MAYKIPQFAMIFFILMISFWPTDWSGLLAGWVQTLWLVLLASVLALVWGALCAYLKRYGSGRGGRLAAWLVAGYVSVFRNTPLLIQLYFFYRGLHSAGVLLSPTACGVLGLSLYNGAYLVEIFRAGLDAVPPQQRDAALSLGLSPWTVAWRIQFPQFVHAVLPAVTNQVCSLAKQSSLLAFITVDELFSKIYQGAVDRFEPLPYFFAGAVLYVATCAALSLALQALARRLTPGAPAWGGAAPDEPPVAAKLLALAS
jgi:polar amino acid transport system permease protein